MSGYDVLVVGAGAAGIMAALRASECGARVLMLEKTPRIGTKILVSGGGNCNITHAGPIEDVLRSFRPNEARFIRPACYRFTNEDVVSLFTSKGLEVYTRPNGRVFPVDRTAKEVVAILGEHLREAGVTVQVTTAVTGLTHEDGRVTGVMTAAGEYPCERVVLSTGGSSYPNSGTTGDGWPWARELGHTVVKVVAALAPIYLTLPDGWADQLSGVALRDIVLKARVGGKEVDRWRDDVLFTHHGVSGPCALEVSRSIAETWGQGEPTLEVDVMPDRSPEQVMEWVKTQCAAQPKKRLRTVLEGVVPESVLPWLIRAAGADPEGAAGQLERKTRNRLVETLKGWTLGVVRTIPLEKGECVAGGISLDEVDPQTMRSRLCEGLYLCGEVLDIAGRVGGYNLQAAWATGYVAGDSASSGIGDLESGI